MRKSDLSRSIFGILPTFVVAAIAGCLIARFVCGIPHEILGIVVLIPLSMGFLLIRILSSIVPDNSEPIQKPTRIDFALIALCGTGLYFAVVLVISAGPYLFVGLPGIALGAIQLAGGFLGFSVLMFVSVLCMEISRTVPLMDVLRILARRFARVFWDSVYLETEWFGRSYESY